VTTDVAGGSQSRKKGQVNRRVDNLNSATTTWLKGIKVVTRRK
jgi:hypothetical protein